MALNILQSPPTPISAFNDNLTWLVETDNSTIEMIKVTVKEGSIIHTVQYNQVINGKSYFNLRGIFTSILNSYTDPISPNPPSNIILNINSNNSAKNLTLDWEEVAEFSITLSQVITIHKNSTPKQNIMWNYLGNEIYPALNFKEGESQVSRYVYPRQIVPLTYIGNNIVHNIIVNGSTFYTSSSITRNYQQFSWRLPLLNSNFKVTSNVNDYTINLIPKNQPTRGQVIYFLNRLGGWDWFLFNDYEEMTNVSKTEYEVYDQSFYGSKSLSTFTESINKRLKLYGIYIKGSETYYLNDLVSSPITLDQYGNRVRVLDSSLSTNINDIYSPSITIEYISKNIINF